MSVIARFIGAAAALAITTCAALADAPVLRASVLKFGTVNWELEAIKHHGFDAANGADAEDPAAATSQDPTGAAPDDTVDDAEPADAAADDDAKATQPAQ